MRGTSNLIEIIEARRQAIEPKRLTICKLLDMIEAHELWNKTDGEGGTRAVFKSVDFINEDLSDLDLECAIFENCSFHNVNFSNCNLYGSQFYFCNLSKSKANKANFGMAFFKAVDLCHSQYTNCDFTYAVFDAVVDNADLTGSKFVNANFNNSSLKNTIVKDADFTDAALEHTLYLPDCLRIF